MMKLDEPDFNKSFKGRDKKLLIFPHRKILCSTTIIALFLLIISSNEIDVQTNKPKLNQLELDMQFIGTWKVEASKDTIITIECKSIYNGNAVETYYKTETKGEIIFEEKSLLGYNKKPINL
jgi:hypothetical protein